MVGNLMKCAFMQKTKMLHVHRNTFLKGLHASNVVAHNKKLCSKKKRKYLNKSVIYSVEIYYQPYLYRNQHFIRCSLSDLEHTKQTEHV